MTQTKTLKPLSHWPKKLFKPPSLCLQCDRVHLAFSLRSNDSAEETVFNRLYL